MSVRNINNRLNGFNPLSYLGDNATQPPNFVAYNRAPTETDCKNFYVGDEWLDNTTLNCYKLVSKEGNVATWVLMTGTGGTVTDLDGDTGTASPVGGVIKIAGGTNMNTAASGSTVTVNLNDDVILSGSLGVQDVVAFASLTDGVLQTDNSGVVSATNGTNGQLLIGGGTAPQWANLTSNGGTIIITQGSNSLNIEAAGGGGTQGSLVFLAEGTSAGGTSIDFETELTPTYNDYLFILDNINPTVGNNNFICQLSTDGGGTYITTGYANNEPVTNGISFINTAGGGQPTTNSYSSTMVSLINATSGVGYVQNSPAWASINDPVATTVSAAAGVGGYQTPNIVVNAVRFLFDDGSAFDGRIKIYGFGTPPPPPTGALVLIETQTAAADTELDFTTGITSTYNNYSVVFNNITSATVDQDFIMQLSANGGVSFIATGYFSNDVVTAATGIVLVQQESLTVTATAFRNGSSDIMNLTSGAGYVANGGGSFLIGDAASTPEITLGDAGGFYGTPNLVVNALRFKLVNGTAFSGTVSLYGYVK